MTRDEAVQSLARFDKPLPLLEAELSSWPWDWEGAALATLDAAAVATVLRRHAAGALTDNQVEQWANLIEVRDDVDFTEEASEAVFWLANPLINGPLAEIAPALLSRFS